MALSEWYSPSALSPSPVGGGGGGPFPATSLPGQMDALSVVGGQRRGLLPFNPDDDNNSMRAAPRTPGSEAPVSPEESASSNVTEDCDHPKFSHGDFETRMKECKYKEAWEYCCESSPEFGGIDIALWRNDQAEVLEPV